MKIKRLFFIALLLTACTTPTKVHLYGRYLSESNIKDVTENLKKAGFLVEVNQHSFPTSINQSTILYSPLIKDRNAVKTVIHHLSVLDIPIYTAQPLVEGKHFYTKNNLGLFLLPKGNLVPNQLSEIDMANEYKSINCENEIKLHLNRDKSYEFVIDKLPYPSESAYLNGVWRVTQYPFISLGPRKGQEWFYFEVKEESEFDKLGAINQVKLISQDNYSYLHYCNFVHGVRQ